LSRAADEAIGDPANTPFVSAASVWEIAIKRALGKLAAPDDLLDQLEGRDVVSLPVTAGDAWYVRNLPRHHQDPFDRVLVAQAVLRDLVVLTADPVFSRYGVAVMAAR
jgi:PIN domain nuclease of toxin-antitoxin system